MCFDEEIFFEDFLSLEMGKVFGMLLLVLCECGLLYGIEMLVLNYELQLVCVYCWVGFVVEEVGCVDGYGCFLVCCGVFEVLEEVCMCMQQVFGVVIFFYVGYWLCKIVDSEIVCVLV